MDNELLSEYKKDIRNFTDYMVSKYSGNDFSEIDTRLDSESLSKGTNDYAAQTNWTYHMHIASQITGMLADIRIGKELNIDEN